MTETFARAVIPMTNVSQLFTLYHGDNREIMRELPSDSVDSIVCDPPYELGFMGKKWDASGIAYSVEMWQEALRVLKPGGHLLAFSGSRTYHRMTVAIEDAGFEIRDQIMWIYGSGFPKSHNIEKAINKLDGVKFVEKPASGVGFMNAEGAGGYNTTIHQLEQVGESSERAAKWQGWGTALKPAHEPIVVARKPLIGTVAENVLTYGTGALNIDGARVDGREVSQSRGAKETSNTYSSISVSSLENAYPKELGRWPANVIHDGSDEVVAGFPSSTNVSKGIRGRGSEIFANGKGFANTLAEVGQEIGYGDSGSAARFFYCAKASKKDRNEGLEGFEEQVAGGMRGRQDGSMGSIMRNRNHHPTVKPTDLMRYLCRLVTPPGGVILDPFMGSGSTGKAAVLEGFHFIGIEMMDEYMPIAQARIEYAVQQIVSTLEGI